MKKLLSSIPLFVILLPIFFVLHGFAGNFGYIDIIDCLWLVLTYLLATTILYLLFYLLYRNHIRTALAVTCLLSFYFFFGAIHDFLYAHSIFLYRYKIILPAFSMLLVFIWICLKKTKGTLTRITSFLNILFCIYLLFDLSEIIFKSLRPSPYKLAVYDLPVQNGYSPCDTCADPDIYFLLFDEYASSASLKKRHSDNSGLDSFLLQNGFHIQCGSHSNYNFTPFSMASILNMSYLRGIGNPDACDIPDYALCNKLIRNNETIRYLSSRHYDIINYSIFELAGNPSLVNETLLPLKTNLIMESTLLACVTRDISWHFPPALFRFKWFFEDPAFDELDNNNLFLEKVKKESTRSASHPRFIYAHFEMPHTPFYYDSTGRLRDKRELLFGYDDDPVHISNFIQGYKDYLPYTNSKIKELITAIQQNTHHKAVIILMGDHGLRCDLPGQSRLNYFENQNAIYFPDKDYHLLYDSISGVNEFRVVFNKLFNQDMPLLADSVVFLTDKK